MKMKERITKLYERKGKGIYSIIKKDTKFKKEICDYVPFVDPTKTIEQLYCIMNDIREPVLCQHCKTEKVTFKNLKLGYLIYCSKACTSRATREKAMGTIKKNHGGLHHTQTKEWKDKNPSSFRNPETQQKAQDKIDFTKRNKTRKDNLMKNYGVDNIMHIPEIKEKVVNNLNNKTTEEWDNIVKKRMDTHMEKYGKYFNNTEKTHKQFKDKYWDTMVNMLSIKNVAPNFDKEEYLDYKNHDNEYEFLCLECGKTFKIDVSVHGFEVKRIKCVCQKYRSKYEQEIVRWLHEVKPDIVIMPNYRIKLECDIYLPEYDFGIEFNGLYWHNDTIITDKKYHFNKTMYFKENGISIMHVFENEWLNKKEIMKSMIMNRLGLNKSVYGRKCEIKEISVDEYKAFCELNHIQGYNSASIKIGLFHGDEIVGSMSFSKKGDGYENTRTCFKKGLHVLGGTNKMFKYFLNKYNPKEIISFCDIGLFGGKSYLNMGYKLHSYSIDYFYFKGTDVKRRYECQKHLLVSFLDEFDTKLSEYENMRRNGYMKVNCAGNYKFVYENLEYVVVSEEVIKPKSGKKTLFERNNLTNGTK
jgi:hypothetical protein